MKKSQLLNVIFFTCTNTLFMTPSAVLAVEGAAIYKSYCAMCHDSGAAGSPRLGDKAAWQERLKQGGKTLEQHAIEGFQSMPARGGFPSLKDEEVKAAVAHMVEAVK